MVSRGCTLCTSWRGGSLFTCVDDYYLLLIYHHKINVLIRQCQTLILPKSIIPTVLLNHLAKRTRVRFSWEEINHPPNKLIPFFLVVLSQISCNIDNYTIQSFYPPIDVAFLGICNRSELMFLLYHFWEVPQLWWSAHVLCCQWVVKGFHMF